MVTNCVKCDHPLTGHYTRTKPSKSKNQPPLIVGRACSTKGCWCGTGYWGIRNQLEEVLKKK